MAKKSRGRRINGEGAIYFESSSGLYRGELRINGQRRRVSGRSEEDVAAKLSVLRLEMGAGVADEDVTLGEWIEWFGAMVLDGKHALTAQSYRWALAQSKPLQSKKLADLTVADVEGLLLALSRRKPSRPARKPDGRGSDKGTVRGPLGQTSLRRVRGALALCLREAEARGMIVRNVAALAKIPPKATPPRKRRSLTPAQAEKMRKRLTVNEDGALVLTMLTLGLRPGEALALPWDALDLKRGTLMVRQALIRTLGGGVEVGDPKTAGSVRTLKMPTGLTERLKVHKREQAELRKARMSAGNVWLDPSLVFPNSHGGLRNHGDLQRIVRALGAQVGVDGLTPHELRHSAASLLVEDGAPLAAVADQLGHTSLDMLSRVYRHKVSDIVDLTAHMGKIADG